MGALGGYAGNILYVDLNNRSAQKKPLPEDYVQKFTGGPAINSKLAYDLIRPGIGALSPENVLVFGSGPFVGTIIPGSAKSNIQGKSPLTGFLGSSGGGELGMLKFAGYDHMAVSGELEKPSYLRIRDEEVEFCDAAHLWGKNTWETTDSIWDELGEDYVVAAIGPAGENLVRDSSIIVNKSTAFARTGLGAVMGAKKLKAITLYGTKGIKVADPERFIELADKLIKDFMAPSFIKDWRTYGTLISLEQMLKVGMIPHKNFQDAAGEDMMEDFDLGVFREKIKEGDVACMSCPLGCKHFMRLKEGEHAGLSLSVSCLNSVIQSLGSYCSIRNWNKMIDLFGLCNQMGLDYYSFADMFAFVTELYQKGLINKAKTEGIEFQWGSAEAVREMIEKTVRRDGLGDVFAGGIKEVIKYFGEAFEDYAMHVKGLGVMLDPRAVFSTEAFSHFINPRGGHEDNLSFTMFPGSPERQRESAKRYSQRTQMPEDALDRVLEGPLGYNPGRLTKWLEDYNFFMESLGVCSFAMFQRFNVDVWTGLYSALTGIERTPAEFLKAAERGWNMKRAFNLREGAKRSDDHAPKRFMIEPLKVGTEIRQPLGVEQTEKLIDDYYDERGWDPVDGSIKQEKLRELDLEL